jgi:glycosyltransferase involved in cell wall biosynthesis
MPLTVMQLLPALDVGGVERGTLEIAAALVANKHRAIVVSSGGRLVEELKAIGATHIECPIGKKSLRTLRCIKRLRQFILQENVDIVHARSRLPAWIGYRALAGIAEQRRPHWVTTIHGPYTVNAYSRIMVSGERVIAISAFIEDYIKQHYPRVPTSRIRVIPRGVDPSKYWSGYAPSPQWKAQWSEQHPTLNGQRLLVLPGRLTRWKGQQDFIALIGELNARGQPVHGLIAGGAAPRDNFERELRGLAAASGLEQKISFLGRREDLRAILSIADIAYSLTLEPEAFGRTTIEALSLGTPVIGYDHGGTGEILRQLLPQGLVAPRDIAAAVETSCAFLKVPVEVPVQHPYTVARMQADTLNAYLEVCPQYGLHHSHTE